jgi:hypothetical protein
MHIAWSRSMIHRSRIINYQASQYDPWRLYAVPITACYEASVEYGGRYGGSGYNVHLVPAVSPIQCQIMCQQESNCTHWTFYMTENTCMRLLGNGTVPDRGIGWTWAYSGSAKCRAYTGDLMLDGSTFEPTCVMYKTRQLGGDLLAQLYSMWMPQQCQSACFSDPRCQVWNLNYGTGTCELRTFDPSSTPVTDAATVTGRFIAEQVSRCRMSNHSENFGNTEYAAHPARLYCNPVPNRNSQWEPIPRDTNTHRPDRDRRRLCSALRRPKPSDVWHGGCKQPRSMRQRVPR